MTWPYHFLELTAAEKYDRRLSLNKHAAYAQLSALLPLVLVLIVRCARWLAARIAARRGTYDAVPNSPAAKHQRKSSPAWWLAAGRRLSWWLGDDIVVLGQNFGRRDQLVFGTAWALWLLFLSLQGTGEGETPPGARTGFCPAVRQTCSPHPHVAASATPRSARNTSEMDPLLTLYRLRASQQALRRHRRLPVPHTVPAGQQVHQPRRVCLRLVA